MGKKNTAPADTDYLYVSARLRSLELHNLTREKYEKMIESKSADDASTVLAECEYGDGLISEKVGSFEELFAKEQKKAYDLVEEIIPDKNLLYFFKYQNDCHNLKSCIKSEFMGAAPGSLLSPLGTVPPESAAAAVRERNLSAYPANMAAAFGEAVDSFARNRDPMFIDVIMDRACFADMIEAANESRAEFLIRLVRLKTDLVNIMTATRIMRMKYSLDVLRRSVIEGGNLDAEFFISNFDSTENKMFDALRYTDYYSLSELAAGGSGITLARLEKNCDEIYAARIRETRLMSYGPEIVVGYIAAKEAEIKNVRIVISGKQADISGDVIRERLRGVYVN